MILHTVYLYRVYRQLDILPVYLYYELLLVAYAFSVKYFKNTNIRAYAGLRVKSVYYGNYHCHTLHCAEYSSTQIV